MPLQEVTLDFDSFSILIQKIVTDSFKNPNYYNDYRDLIRNIKQFHHLCIDKKTNNGESEWFNKFQDLQKELCSLFPEALHIHKLIIDHFSPLFQSTELRRISCDKKELVSICKDIARKTDFKILIDDSTSTFNDINKVTIKEFNYGFIPVYKCLLLRREKNIDFLPNEDTNFLKFLHPYIYYSNRLEIWDKYFLRQDYHLKILNILLSYIKAPKNIIIHTEISECGKALENIMDSIKNDFPSVKFEIKDNKEAHPRKIITDYAIIRMDNTLDNFTYSNNQLKTKKDISFNIKLNELKNS